MIKILSPKQKQFQNFLKEQEIKKNIKYIDSPYLIKIEDYNDLIVENILTGEVISQSIPFNENDNDFLIKNWFKIPEKNFNIYDFFQNVIQKHLSDSLKNLNNYNLLENFDSVVIFTTLGCNANCFYCYEKNLRNQKYHMTEEVADKLIQRMLDNNQKIYTLNWFGGEPLFNEKIIDYICSSCKEKNINFVSSMISNGLLFNEQNVLKAKELWKLKSVQITIDGSEKAYEKIKDVKSGSFKKLIKNIHLLLEAGIQVSIRLNLNTFNYKDLKEVIKILYKNFKKYLWSEFNINIHELFGEEKEKNIYENMYKLELYIESLFHDKNWLKNCWKPVSCMVDTGKTIALMPNGDITICEHYIDKDIITNIDKDFYNIDTLNKYAYQYDNKDCQFCTIRPGCIFSSECPVHGGKNCNPERVKYIIRNKKKNLALIAKKQRKRRKHLMITREMYKNIDIYNKATALIEAFNTQDGSNLNYPVKVNFYLQKNMNTIIELAKEIEQKRIEIVQKYGQKKEDSEEYIIPEDKMDEAGKELQDFFELEQEMPINMLKLDWFDNIDMTAAQVAAISFMIEEEE